MKKTSHSEPKSSPRHADPERLQQFAHLLPPTHLRRDLRPETSGSRRHCGVGPAQQPFDVDVITAQG